VRTAEGIGTTMRVWLPLAPDAPPDQPESDAAPWKATARANGGMP
jgi:hypothetical protein